MKLTDMDVSVVQSVVSIVIVTYNSSHVIEHCLRSIISPDIEIVVVDNDSTDSTVNEVISFAPSAMVIRNSNNMGFSKAVRVGIEASSSEYILLLNPDCFISSESVMELVAAIRADPRIGAIGPRLDDGTGTDATITAGHFPTLWRMFTHMTGLSRLANGWKPLEGHYLFSNDLSESIRDVDWITGGCMLFPRRSWDSVGGMTDRWFMYAEDIDFCWQLKLSGSRIAINPQVRAIHEMGGSSANVDGRANTAWLLNLFDFVSWRIYSSLSKRYFWRHLLVSGFAVRMVIFKILSWTVRGDKRSAMSRRSRLFGTYACSLLNRA